MLCITALFRTSGSGILSFNLIFNIFLKQLKWKCLHAYKRVGSTTALKTFSMVSNMIPFGFQTFALSLSSECHTWFCNSEVDLTINVHCSEESAFHVGEFLKTKFSVCLFTVIVGSLCGFLGTGWCTPSVILY